MAKTIEILTIDDLVQMFTCSTCENEIRSAYYMMVRVPGSKREPALSDGKPLDWAIVHYKKCREVFEVWNPGEWNATGQPSPEWFWKIVDGLAD